MSEKGVVWRVVPVAAALWCIVPTVQAQRFVVIGSVTDSAGVALAQATVVVLARADSALVQFGTSRGDGAFAVKHLLPGAYVLQVSYVGFATALRDFEMGRADVDVGRMVLWPQTNVLEEFVVTGDRLPYVVRGDTLEYNALAFITRPQDMVEDLLRRLPGIEVDRYGNVIAYGELVQRLLVEGREFFGDDPTIATRNLPADAVERVQIYDQPSDRAELTGVPDGREEKTMNLALTEEAKRGAFGQITSGAGIEQGKQGHYLGRVSTFRFAPVTQLALIGGAENINRPVFSGRQLASFTGASQVLSLAGESDGWSQSLGTGLNTNRDFGDKVQLNASYLLTDRDNRQEHITNRDQLLGSAVTATSDESHHRETANLAHTVILHVESRFAEGHDLVVRGNMSRTLSSGSRAGLETTADPRGMPLNTATTSVSDDRTGHGGGLRLTWRKRIAEGGRSLIAEGSVGLRDAQETRVLHSESRLYNLGDLQTREEQQQEQQLLSEAVEHRQRLELLEPLRTGRTLSMYVQRFANRLHQDKAYFDLVGGQNVLDPKLSQVYDQIHKYWRSGTSFRLQNEARTWWLSGELELQHSRRRGRSTALDQTLKSRYMHLLPRVVGQWELGGGSSLDLFYYSRTREPSLRQLQPFTDNRNPLRVYVGNPALTPEYHHDLSVQYWLHRGFSGLILSADANAVYTRNSIVSVRTVDADFRQQISAVNAGPAWTRSGGIHFNMPVRRLDLEWGTDIDVDWDTATEYVNGSENEAQILRGRLSLDLEYRYRDVLEVLARARRSYNESRYSLNAALNQSYINGTVDVEVYWRPSPGWSLESSVLYRILDSDAFGTGENITLLNLSASRHVWEGRVNLELELHDALNQNQLVDQTSAATYLQETRAVSLGRYIMLNLTYKPRLR